MTTTPTPSSGASGLEVRAPSSPGFEEILTPEALGFVEKLDLLGQVGHVTPQGSYIGDEGGLGFDYLWQLYHRSVVLNDVRLFLFALRAEVR